MLFSAWYAVYASNVAGHEPIPSLNLEKKVDLPGKPETVIGSLFSPLAVSGQDDHRNAFIALLPSSETVGTLVTSPWHVYASRNGRYAVIDVLEDPKNPQGSVISTLYELPEMRKMWTRKGPSAVALISDDGKTVVFHNVGMLSSPTLEFYDEKGTCVYSCAPPEDMQGKVALAPSGSFVLVGTGAGPAADAKITKYDRRGREMTVFDPRMGRMNLLAISPDETRVVAYFRLIADQPKAQMYLLDAQLNEITAEDPGTQGLSRAIFSPDSTRVAAVFGEVLQLRDSVTGRTLWEKPWGELVGPQKWHEVALAKRGDRVAISAFAYRSSTSLDVARSSVLVLGKSGEAIGKIDRGAHAPIIERLEFSADGRKLAFHIRGDGIEHCAVPTTGGNEQ